MMIKGVDCIETDTYRETADYIERVINTLNTGPYRTPPTIFHLQSRKLAPNHGFSAESKLWASQLINIPGISETKAKSIIDVFPVLSSLMDAYQDPDTAISNKIQLLSSLGERNEKKISRKIFRLYTSLDPDEIL